MLIEHLLCWNIITSTRELNKCGRWDASVLNPLFSPYSALSIFFSHESWEEFSYTNLNSRWESLLRPPCVACCGLFSWDACCLLWRPVPLQTSADGSLFPRQLAAGDGCGAILALQLLWSHVATRLHVNFCLLCGLPLFPPFTGSSWEPFHLLSVPLQALLAEYRNQIYGLQFLSL